MAYYGFQKEKNIDKSIIDWSSITKKISDDLISTGEDRQKQRNELEDTQVENINTIKNYVTGEDTDMNSFVLEQSQSTRGFLSAIHKQMTSGKISVDKAKRIKQRVMNSWGSVSEASKTFQENAKRLGNSKGKANEALLNIMGLNADLNNKQIYHDPETGEGYYVDVDKKTGEVDLSTAKPISAINNVQRKTKQYVDVLAETAAIAKRAPKIKLAISGTTDINYAIQSKSYQDYLVNATNANLSDDERMVSVGLDFLDMEYTVDGEGSSDTTISYDKVTGYNSDGTPIYKKEQVSIGKIDFNSSTGEANLTPKQRQVIKDGYMNTIIAQLPRETSEQYVDPRSTKPTPTENAIANSVNLINRYVYDGDVDALQSALTSLENSPYVSVTKPDENGVIQLNKSDGTYDELKTKDRGAFAAGEQLAGFLGIAGEYKGRKGVEDLLNPNVSTTPSAAFTQRYSLNPSQQKEFTTLLEGSTNAFDRIIPPTETDIRQAATKAADALGIPSGRIKVVREGDSFTIRYAESDNIIETGRVIGIVGVDSPNEILKNLEAISAPIRSKGTMTGY